MAKRRRKIEEEEELEFVEPEFDEREYLKSEIKKGRGIFIIFILAIVMGFVSAYLQVYVDIIVALLVGISPLFVINRILKFFKAEFSTKSTWVFAILAFIFIWIAIWSVGLNPPFNDLTPPQIRKVEVYNGTAWVEIYDYSRDVSKNIKKVDWKNSVDIRVLATDNVGVESVKINDRTAKKNGDYYEVDNIVVSGEIKIVAWDVNGHSSEKIIATS